MIGIDKDFWWRNLNISEANLFFFKPYIEIVDDNP